MFIVFSEQIDNNYYVANIDENFRNIKGKIFQLLIICVGLGWFLRPRNLRAYYLLGMY